MHFNENDLIHKKIFSYKFNESIDKIYASFFNPRILEKAKILGVLYDIEISSDNCSDAHDVNSFLVHFLQSDYSMERLIENKIETPLMKSLTYRIIAINGEIIDFLFRIKVNLFMDSSNFSTTFTLEIESESLNNPYIIEYFEKVPLNVSYEFCNKLQAYLTKWNVNTLIMQSIVINRPLKQVFDFIIDFKKGMTESPISLKNDIVQEGEKGKVGTSYVKLDPNGNIKAKITITNIIYQKQKAIISIVSEINLSQVLKNRVDISIIQLSSVSSFVNVETDFHYMLKGDLKIFVQEMHQEVLKSIKKELEKNTCYV